MTLPRPEYPRPQFVRREWLNLNGPWQFETDATDDGFERGLLHQSLTKAINVPFCLESTLSGIGYTGFMPAVWYRRDVEIPAAWAGRRVLLHFGAADYDTTVWCNGLEVGRHRGGFSSFTFDLGLLGFPKQAAGGTSSASALDGANPGTTCITLVVRVQDSHLPPQARGKQSQKEENHACFYTRTTGIWQTVWLEPVPDAALCRPKITPDVGNSLFHIALPVSKAVPGYRVRACLWDDSGEISASAVPVGGMMTPQIYLRVPANKRQLWSPETPHLYSIKLQLLSERGVVLDEAASYAGLREIAIQGKAVLLNGEPVFQRLVLDQGFYPDGILTAPSDEALVADIQLSLATGFNGARLHQKVFEERFLYHADRLGYLVWGEYADWGCAGYGSQEELEYHDHQKPAISYISEWLEVLQRDYSHPCIVGWCPLNETWQVLHDRTTDLDDATRALFFATKAFDTTRPVIDASGYSHRVPQTDIYDSHDYEQNPCKFAMHHSRLAEGIAFVSKGHGAHQPAEPYSVPYCGQPYFVSEFGGILWNPDNAEAWGYGETPKTLEEFYARFEGLCGALLENEAMFGYCYTQLTDVFQEQNGLFTFHREPKFNLARIRAAQTRPAAIETAPAERSFNTTLGHAHKVPQELHPDEEQPAPGVADGALIGGQQ